MEVLRDFRDHITAAMIAQAIDGATAVGGTTHIQDCLVIAVDEIEVSPRGYQALRAFEIVYLRLKTIR